MKYKVHLDQNLLMIFDLQPQYIIESQLDIQDVLGILRYELYEANDNISDIEYLIYNGLTIKEYKDE